MSACTSHCIRSSSSTLQPRQQVRQRCTILQPCRCQPPAGPGLDALGAQQQQRIAAAERRKAQLADALQNGVRVVIDCSYAQAAQQWVEQQQRQRQQHQQQQEQIWRRSQPSDPGQQQQRQDSACQPSAAAHTSDSHQQHSHDSSDPSTATATSSSSSNSNTNSSSTVSSAADSRHLVTGTFIHKEVRSVAKQIELAAAVNKR